MDPSITASGLAVHVIWWGDRDGNREIYYKRNPTGNSGTEETWKQGDGERVRPKCSAVPNPFTSFTSFSGHEAERFILYDISGRRVGVWKGDRVGEGLSPGVYFLKSEGKDTKPLRIVKLR
jgi:hypothetical protein